MDLLGAAAAETTNGNAIFLDEERASSDFFGGGISVGTLQRWRCLGKGPAFHRFGRRILYRVDDLLSWASSHRFGSTTEADASRPKDEPRSRSHRRDHDSAGVTRRNNQTRIAEAEGTRQLSGGIKRGNGRDQSPA